MGIDVVLVGPHRLCPRHERTEVGVLIPQLCCVNLDSRFNQAHHALHVPATIESNRGGYTLLLHIEDYTIALVQAAAYDQLVPTAVEARVLYIVVVLVRPEPMYVIVGLELAKHTTSCRPSLMDCILPVLNPDQPPEEGMEVIGHISRGINAIYIRLAVLLAHGEWLRRRVLPARPAREIRAF